MKNEPILGQVIESEQERDAIHIAIAPVIASKRLAPGEHVGLVNGEAGPTGELIGIVDPFLRGPVFKGERFWLFLYPQTITSLRHLWTHPAFASSESSSSQKWIKDFADSIPMHVDELMDAARGYVERGDYLIQGGRFEGESVPDEFWPHYEAVTGTKVGEEKRGTFFSCSC